MKCTILWLVKYTILRLVKNIRVKTFFVVSKIYLVGVRQRSLEVSNLACKG